jgi:hypothetical protein
VEHPGQDTAGECGGRGFEEVALIHIEAAFSVIEAAFSVQRSAFSVQK